MKKIALISSLLLSLSLSGCVLDASGPGASQYPNSGTTTFEPASPSTGMDSSSSSSSNTSFEPASPSTSMGSSNTSFEPASSNGSHTSRPNY